MCKLIIDSGSSENVTAADAVKKLALKDEQHPTPYKLAWLQQTHDLLVTRRALVTFSIGDAYHDKIYCDIAPMDACHLLLGRPWEFDRRIIHDGFLNTYTFTFNNRTFTLKLSLPSSSPPTTPSPARPTTSSNPLLLLHKTPLEAAMREEEIVFILTATPSWPFLGNETRPEFQALIKEFADVFPNDLPPGLPPLRDINTK